MKSFIYTYSEGNVPRDGSGRKKTVTVYQIVRNIPRLIGSTTDTFVDEQQLVMACLKEHGALARAVFTQDANEGRKHSPRSLLDKGIARIERI